MKNTKCSENELIESSPHTQRTRRLAVSSIYIYIYTYTVYIYIYIYTYRYKEYQTLGE